MKLQVEVLDVINTGMIEINGFTYYSVLNNSKFFYGKERIFEVSFEPENKVDPKAVMFKYNSIPMGYMIKEHANHYYNELKMMEFLSKTHDSYKYFAVMGDVGLSEVGFGKETGTTMRICYPITIVSKKNG